MNLIPNTLFALNKSFIQVLKSNNGLTLVRNIPFVYTEYFVGICALSNTSDLKMLQEYIEVTRMIFIKHQEVLNKSIFLYFMQKMFEKLQQDRRAHV